MENYAEYDDSIFKQLLKFEIENDWRNLDSSWEATNPLKRLK